MHCGWQRRGGGGVLRWPGDNLASGPITAEHCGHVTRSQPIRCEHLAADCRLSPHSVSPRPPTANLHFYCWRFLNCPVTFCVLKKYVCSSRLGDIFLTRQHRIFYHQTSTIFASFRDTLVLCFKSNTKSILSMCEVLFVK